MNFNHGNNVISTENQIIHVTTATNEPPGTTVGLKSVDLVSVTSSEFNDDDNISFDEGRLQQWNFDEFWAQMKSASAAIVLMVACCIQSTWSINEYLKLLIDKEDETSTWNDTDSTSGYDLVDELFTSESVTVTTVIISWNIGAIFGGVLGAFIVPVLTNKIIYIAAVSFLSFSGVSLLTNGSVYQFIKGRFFLGLTHGLVQLAVIVQAAESTTKKVRRLMLTILVYMCTLSSIASTVLVLQMDKTNYISYQEQSQVTTMMSLGIFGVCVIALLLNIIFTQDTISFLLNRGDETKAFKMLTQLKFQHLSMIDIRYEFERIRFDTAQEQLYMNRSMRSKSNFIPLTTMCAVRILNLLFTNIPMTILLVWPVDDDEADDGTHLSPLGALLLLQIIRMLTGFCITVSQDKYRFNRFVYKFSILCGMCLLISFTIYVLMGSFNIKMNSIYFPLSILIAVAFVMLPLPLDCLQMVQTADSYAHCKNTWMLSFAIFIEHFVHIILIVQMDMIFDLEYAFLIIGASMMYLGLWLLRTMPNDGAVHPITVTMLTRYPFKRAETVETVHI